MAFAAETTGHTQNFTNHWAGWQAVGLFIIAYAVVIAEEALHLRKSKLVMVASRPDLDHCRPRLRLPRGYPYRRTGCQT
jgi:hypothetical protein